MNSKRLLILISILTITVLSGCVRSTHVRGTVVVPVETHRTTVVTHYAPPPHAPAHGHRHHYHNHELEYYSDLGAYVVIGTPGLYFYGDRYLRFFNGIWEFSIELGKPWRPALERHVPRNLRDRHMRKHRAERHEHRHEENHHRHDKRHETPRHGHRRHHHGHDLSYDAGIGAYRIIRQPGIYFYDDRYIRYYRGNWQVTKRLNGKWRSARERQIPVKLWRKHTRHSKKRDRHDTDNRDNYRKGDRHRHENRRDDYRRDKYQRDDKRRDDYRRKDKRRDRDDDEHHQEHRYDDGKKLQNINEKFYQGLE